MKRFLTLMIESPLNKDVRGYSVDEEISRKRIEHFERPLRDKSYKVMAGTGTIGSIIIDALFDIDGVMGVFLSPYEVTVEKGKAFGWSDIEPGIINILEEALEYESEDTRIIRVTC